MIRTPNVTEAYNCLVYNKTIIIIQVYS